MSTEQKPLTVAEFKMWLETVEEFHAAEGNEWYPTESQWKKIRGKIESLEVTSFVNQMEQLLVEIHQLKTVLNSRQMVPPQPTPQQPMLVPQMSTLGIPESTLDVAPLQPAPTPSGKVAPDVTLPPSVTTRPSGDGQPIIRVDPRYDASGNYVSSFAD